MRHTLSRLALVVAAAVGALAVPSFAGSIAAIDPLDSGAKQNFTDSFEALFSLTATQPAASGVLPSFVRLQNEDNQPGCKSTRDVMDAINFPRDAGDAAANNDEADHSFRLTSSDFNGFRIALDADAGVANDNGGAADLDVIVPLLPDVQSLHDATHFTYAYSRFGSAVADFEEWSSLEKVTPNVSAASPAPELATFGILAAGVLTLLGRWRTA